MVKKTMLDRDVAAWVGTKGQEPARATGIAGIPVGMGTASLCLLLVMAMPSFAGGQQDAVPSPTKEPPQTKGVQDARATGPQGTKHGQAEKTQARTIADLDLQANRGDILAHLNAVIGFYRASIQPIQKAGEPNDVVYFDQSVELASQAATYAFEAAQAEAGMASEHQGSSTGDRQRLQSTKTAIDQALVSLTARADGMDKEMATAKPQQMAALRAQRKDIEAAIELNKSIEAALQKIVGVSDTRAGSGLTADIERLQRSVPELNSKTKIAAPQLTTLESARSSGVSSQGAVLFQLLETRHELDTMMTQNDSARQAALAVRAPVSAVIRTVIAKGQTLTQQAVSEEPPEAAPTKSTGKGTAKVGAKAAPVAAKGAQAAAVPAAASGPGAPAGGATTPATETTGETLGSINSDFNALASAAIPLNQELIVLEESRANLTAWRGAVQQEYKEILHALLLRVTVIAVALGIIFVAGEVWRRATNKYIRDTRRRRQLLVVRRAAIGFLSVIVVLFGFVTQFNSLATFAGFITAGIAVGLQTILLSVAAYFFIVGRYGVKVGDRITISSVTGDVIDVGLVRFYMMELAGSGVELNPTGRVAVFSNAVLFQAGTPLYKQIPGTEFAWHELIVKLSPTADYLKVSEAVMKEVGAVYETYRGSIERQHREVENWMQAPIPAPGVESRLQLTGGAFQLWARFPVEIGTAAQTDEELTKRVLRLMEQSDEFKQAFAGTPVIQASVKG